MTDNQKIIQVDASFCTGKELLQYLSKYARQTDEKYVYWDDFAFTTEETENCDGLLIFNEPSKKLETRCHPEWVIAFMMEPGFRSEHPWMYKNLQQYAKVYSPVKISDNTIPSHGFLGWYLPQNWYHLNQLGIPVKKNPVSCIASDIARFSGQRVRKKFVELLKSEIPEIHFFGKGSRFIDDKTDGLLNYRYSIAIENSSIPDYFTEKINDCFLNYTVPIYYGCTNISDYFPEGSFIVIDIKDPEKALGQVKQILEKDDWHERLDAVEKARQLVLHQYQPLAGAAAILRSIHVKQSKIPVKVSPLPPTLLKKIPIWWK